MSYERKKVSCDSRASREIWRNLLFFQRSLFSGPQCEKRDIFSSEHVTSFFRSCAKNQTTSKSNFKWKFNRSSDFDSICIVLLLGWRKQKALELRAPSYGLLPVAIGTHGWLRDIQDYAIFFL